MEFSVESDLCKTKSNRCFLMVNEEFIVYESKFSGFVAFLLHNSITILLQTLVCRSSYKVSLFLPLLSVLSLSLPTLVCRSS